MGFDMQEDSMKQKGPEHVARGLLRFGPVALYLRAQLSTRLELDNVLSCDGDGLTRLWVATLALRTVRYLSLIHI